ncbi:MAG: hypothetical protein R2911_37060 [Caldilineaceae bacterium]
MAGSSAIIVSTLRCLMTYYDVQMPLEIQPTFVLSVELELGITGGLQDRVIQCYEGVVFMDFAQEQERTIHGLRCFRYEPLDPALLPALYMAYHNALSEPTELFHNDIRGRYDRGDQAVIGAMDACAALARAGRAAILSRDGQKLSQLINDNFKVRRGIYNLPSWQVEMVETAQRCGASAKFAGSGGAIIGVYEGEEMFQELVQALGAIGSRTFKPVVGKTVEE